MRTQLGWTVGVALVVALASFVSVTSAADMQFGIVIKQESFTQTGAASPVAAALPFSYNTSAYEADTTSPDHITGGSVTGPAPVGTQNLFQGQRPTHWRLPVNNFATVADLNTSFPNGAYTLTINTADSVQHAFQTQTLTGDAYPSVVPHVANTAALGAINAAQPFTISWDAWTGGTTSNGIFLQVADSLGNLVYFTPLPGTAGALNGIATQQVVPAGTLLPGNQYSVELLFAADLSADTTSYSGVAFLSAYVADTQAVNAITTVPEPASLLLLALGATLGLRRRR